MAGVTFGENSIVAAGRWSQRMSRPTVSGWSSCKSREDSVTETTPGLGIEDLQTQWDRGSASGVRQSRRAMACEDRCEAARLDLARGSHRLL